MIAPYYLHWGSITEGNVLVTPLTIPRGLIVGSQFKKRRRLAGGVDYEQDEDNYIFIKIRVPKEY